MSDIAERLRIMDRVGLLDAAELPGFRIVQYGEAAGEIERLEQANAAIMAERTSLIETKRDQLAALTAERDALKAKIEVYEGADDGWRDMATAPLDGTDFLGVYVDPLGLEPPLFFVVSYAWEEEGKPVWSNGDVRVHLNHWHPLPPIPLIRKPEVKE